MEKIKRFFRIANFFFELFFAYICAFVFKLFNRSYRNLWIVSERGNDARDNGYFFYKYLRKKHPEINAWYVIDSQSADFRKVSAIGPCVEYNSFKHFVIYAASELRISSSMWGGDLPRCSYFYNIRKMMSKKRKFVFLKHGIIKDYLPQHCVFSGKPDLYICGAKPEYEYVKAAFGHAEGVVQYTGLARFDNLHNVKTKRQILIMPTFRRWLQKMTPEEVQKSEYVQVYNMLLHNAELQNKLEQNNLELIFYPHHVMQKYVDYFSTDCKNMTIAKFKDYDVQQLLIESKLLITDFSSVFFDFAYMDKPVLYYQFDRERYIKEHYDFTKGYFSYENDGFGKVVYDADNLVKEIISMIDQNFAVSETYQKRIDKFFPLKDEKNCDRIFDEIERVL